MTSTDVRTDSAGESGGGKADRPGRTRGRARSLGLCAAVLALLLAGTRLSLLSGLGGLFGEQTQDRSGPAVLKSIQDMSAYEAASGNFQVVVDLEKDAEFLPDAVRGTRTLYDGTGTVGA